MTDGTIEAEGNPQQIITTELISRVFGIDSTILVDPVTDTPLVIPRGRHGHRTALHHTTDRNDG